MLPQAQGRHRSYRQTNIMRLYYPYKGLYNPYKFIKLSNRSANIPESLLIFYQFDHIQTRVAAGYLEGEGAPGATWTACEPVASLFIVQIWGWGQKGDSPEAQVLPAWSLWGEWRSDLETGSADRPQAAQPCQDGQPLPQHKHEAPGSQRRGSIFQS